MKYYTIFIPGKDWKKYNIKILIFNPLLEILLYCDEQSVRIETLKSFQDILNQINFSDIEKEVFEIEQL